MATDYSLRTLRNRRLRGRSEVAAPAPFVVGVGRSGTTLLRMMLDAHPELAMPPETHFANPFIQASGRLRFNARVATSEIVHDQRRRWKDFGLDEAELLAAMQAVEPFNTTDALRAFYLLYAHKHGKPRWGDKTPDYVRKMKKLQKTLPEAHFIHVIRDGRDAGLSQNARIAKRGKSPIPPKEMARRWRKRILKSQDDATDVEHYIEVRYEDLIADTETVLRRVCDHIDLEFDPAMLRYHERAEERLQEMSGALPAKKGRPEREAGERVDAHAMTTKPPDSDRVAVWKREMSAEENAEFEEAAGHLLSDLGYETSTPRESWTPPEEWARSKDRADRGGGGGGGLLSRLRQRGAGGLSRLRGGEPSGEPIPFVVGMNRSGTTLLRMMLDAHPDLTIPPETHFVPDLIKAVRADGATPESALAAMKSAREWDDFGFSDEEMLGRLRALPALKAGPAVRTFYDAYSEQQGKPRWGEKTPTYVQKMKLIQRALPEAHFVHVIRDGRDVALSVLDRTVRDLTAGDIAKRWQKKVTKAREDSPDLGHYMEIRYEDLILDTEPVLRKVCEFIKLPWDDAMLSYHEGSGERLKEMARALPAEGGAKELSVERRMATHAMTTKPPSADRVARWRTQMSAEQRQEFEHIAGDLLDQLGYPTGPDAVEEATAQIEAA